MRFTRLRLPMLFISICGAIAAMMGPLTVKSQAEEESMVTPSGYEAEAREYLKTLIYTKEDVDNWFARSAFPFCKYDGIMGYLHIDRSFQEGLDNSWASYSYDIHDARRILMYPEAPCRINTYGDSFTSCEQVNDGETWQEVLAAHLVEPVRNYGIGGYSVYQTYLRMKKEEAVTPAEYVIFNIFDDDHYRNLINWQRIRFGTHPKSFHPTLPYVEANRATGTFKERANPCPTRESVYNLTDLEWVYDRFKDDFLLKIVLAQRIARRDPRGAELRDRHLQPALAEGELEGDALADASIHEVIQSLAAAHGIETEIDSPQKLVEVANELYLGTALYATMRIIERAETYAAANNKKILYVLSYPGATVIKRLKEGTRFDQELVDFFEREGLPYIDTLEAHVADYAQFNITPEEYRDRYYVGHYGPAGNFFQAFAIKDKLVEMLDPKPVSYQED